MYWSVTGSESVDELSSLSLDFILWQNSSFLSNVQLLLRFHIDQIKHRSHAWLSFYTRSSSDRDSDHLQLPSTEELIPGLQPLVLWMANSIELLHFIQHEVPQLLPWRQDHEGEGGYNICPDHSCWTCSLGLLLRLLFYFIFDQVCWTLRCHPLGRPVRKPWQSWRKSSCSPFSSLSTI